MAAEDLSEEELGVVLNNSLNIGESLEIYRKYTFPFKRFSAETQAKWLSVAMLENGEIPIYGSFRSEHHWILATTRRFMWVDFLEDLGQHSLNIAIWRLCAQLDRHRIQDFRKTLNCILETSV